MMRRALVLVACCWACTDLAPPDRPSPYTFFLELDDGFRAIFHWPRQSLPVRFWVESDADLIEAVAHGIRVWEDASLYGEFRAVATRDSSIADVIVRRGGTIDLEQPRDGPRPDCLARTTLAATEADSAIVLPFRMTVHRRSGADNAGAAACILGAVAHEMGHTLGILGESDDETDLMHVPPAVNAPSPRDRITLTTLYHTSPTIRLPAGR